ncbi:hypothetical protein MRY87_05390 [bacterium]|nr:hypothetical protein [bacterium]
MKLFAFLFCVCGTVLFMALGLHIAVRHFLEKFFSRSYNRKNGDFIKNLFPGGVWREHKTEYGPAVVVMLNELPSQEVPHPVRITYAPTSPKMRTSHPHHLQFSLPRQLREDFVITRNFYPPEQLLPRILGWFFETFSDGGTFAKLATRVSSPSWWFNIRFDCSVHRSSSPSPKEHGEKVERLRTLLQNEQFRHAISSLLRWRWWKIVVLGGTIHLTYTYSRYSQRPRKKNIEKKLSALFSLSHLPGLLRRRPDENSEEEVEGLDTTKILEECYGVSSSPRR